MTNYVYTTGVHNLSAPREVVPIALQFVQPKSVLDIGCGTGTWLKVFEENGVSDYLGIDGSVVPDDQLHITPAKFQTKDLSKPIDLGRRFDLVVCLEVAEHLPAQFADTLVNTLTKHADAILFSAAIPGQGGQDHVNEQWPEYWQKKFETRGYYFHDVIRPRIWNNPAVESWYKQNIFLINKTKSDNSAMLSVVHPRSFHRDQQKSSGV
jgi:SAM-dependent methyltransferase